MKNKFLVNQDLADTLRQRENRDLHNNKELLNEEICQLCH